MKRVLVVLIGVVPMGVFANQALAVATAVDPGGGYIEVCKAANPALHGNYNFSVWDSFTTDGEGTPTNLVTNAISLTPGTCTSPIAVDPGKVTVTETGGTLGLNTAGNTAVDNSFFTTTATGVGQNSAPTGSFDGKWTYNVTVPAGGPQSVVTVTFTNTLVTGDVEVCKLIAPTSGLSGNWQFTIMGANSFSTTVTVAAGDCSSPIVVPAGRVLVQETGDAAENVTAITATQIAGNVNAIVGPNAGPSADLPTARVVAAVSVGDATNQTIVKFTNDNVRLKLCKYVDAGTPAGTYNFALSSTGNAGPNTVPATASLTATTANNSPANAVCTIIGTYRAGTTVTLTEGIVPGQKVNSITTTPTTNVGGGSTIVPGSLSLPNRTVQVVLGAGETVVYYENAPAGNGLLKLCANAPLGTVTEFTSGLNVGSSPAAVTEGPDGNVWFADRGTTKAIGRITTSGAITEFNLPSTSNPADIEEGPDGNLWFTDQGTPVAIGRISPAGVVTEFRTGLNAGSLPNGLAVGPDGNLWFADRGTTKAIGNITPAGVITEFTLPSTSSPRGIAAGRDGNLWFTDAGTPRQIGRMTTSGTITFFSAGLNAGSSPRAIDLGPNGDLWFNDMGTTKAIGRITTGGTIAEFSSGLNAGSAPGDIAPGPDGNVWFTDRGTTPALGRITPTGTITESGDALPTGSSPRGLAIGPDDNLWFGDDGATKAIGRFTIAGPFNFTVGTQTVTVPNGQCAIVGTFPYDTSLNITEAAVTNITVASIMAVPQFVQVLEGSPPAPVNTNQPVLTNVNLTARSATVTTSEGSATEVTYTNIDPPSSSGGGAGSGSGNAGGSGGAGGLIIGINTSVSTPAVVPTSVGISLGTTAGSTTNNAAVKAELAQAAKLAKLKTTLKLDKKQLKQLRAKLNATKNHEKKSHLKTQIRALKAREAKTAQQIVKAHS